MNDMAHDERHRDQDVATTAALRTIPEPLRSAVDDEFWRYLEQGEVRVQRCGACDTVRYPPEPVCPACLAEDATWQLLTGTGSLLAWTTFHRQYCRSRTRSVRWRPPKASSSAAGSRWAPPARGWNCRSG
jgi:hypothetical protein